MTLSWREEQKRQLREHLYETALALFRSQGFDATKVVEITEKAGVSKGTFFNYFEAKEYLLREWYRRITVDSLKEVGARSFSSAREAIVGLLSALASRATEDADLYAMKEKHVGIDGLLREEERQLDRELSQFLVDQLEAGKERGELREDLDSGLCTSVIISILTGTSHEWVAAGHTFDAGEVLAERVDFLLRGAR